MNAVEQLAIYLKSSPVGDKRIEFPIRKIDGVPVNVFILKASYVSIDGVPCNVYWYFHIVTDTDECQEYIDDDDEFTEITCFNECVKKPTVETSDDDAITFAATRILEILNTYKFSKLTSSFVSPAQLEKEVNELTIFKNMFSSNVTLSYDECCVCLEATRQKTKCGHCLCIVCHSSIKKIEVADSDCKMKCCPMCREEMH